MTRNQVRKACARLPGAVEDFPFGDGVSVFKVGGRMFALVSLDDTPGSLHLKCEPALAESLRAQYDAVRPGYHLNKRHWNTVALDGTVPAVELRWMIEHSYERVVSGLSRAQRAAVGGSAAGS